MGRKRQENLFEGKRIVSVRYMTEQGGRRERFGGKDLSAFKLDDGTIVIPLSDDEGNNGGAFQLIKKDQSYLLPVM